MWVTVAVTDRAFALERMMVDLVQQVSDVGCELSVCIVENSRTAVHREHTSALVGRLTADGVDTHYVSDGPYGRPIAASRVRQRSWVAQQLQQRGPPDLIWMLDDDNRFDHLVFDGQLHASRLEHHVRRLLALCDHPSRPDLLIGTVTGDPPIPAAATIASRAVDVVANLQLLFASCADGDAAAVLAQLPVARGFDDYYDLSHERDEPTWASPRRWLGYGQDETVEQVVNQLLREALLLGSGVALTRPILTTQQDLGHQWTGFRRGGNAVFFSPQACLDHRYPCVDVAGVTTRRGDMIGAQLLARDHLVVTSGFSVRHCRARRMVEPKASGMAASILADTCGAAIVRGLDGGSPERSIRAFLVSRRESIHAAMVASDQALHSLADTLESVPDWVDTEVCEPLARHAARLRSGLPLYGHRLSHGLDGALESEATVQCLADKVADLMYQMGEPS